jgi:hypothetical protein
MVQGALRQPDISTTAIAMSQLMNAMVSSFFTGADVPALREAGCPRTLAGRPALRERTRHLPGS